jgi:hypothetical protein
MHGENQISKISVREKDKYKKAKKFIWGDILS